MKKIYYIFHKQSFLFVLGALWCISLLISRISPAPAQTNFVDLANAFLHGKLYLIEPSRTWDEYALFDGHRYIFHGPLPGIILMPFVFIFGTNFPQHFLTLLASLGTLYMSYQLTIALGGSRKLAQWLSVFFLFGTILLFLSITTITSYETQVVGLFFLMSALWFFMTNKSPVIIGMTVGLAGLTKTIYFPAAMFFIIEWIRTIHTPRSKKSIVAFCLVIGISIILYGVYNFLRFGNFLETGYSYDIASHPFYLAAKSYGIFSLRHIPGNLYLLFLKGPDALRINQQTYILQFPYLRISEWGLGIFYTSPIFLYLILLKKSTKFLVSSLATIGAMLLPVLPYYGTGLWQYGYRYALGIYPFLLILLTGVLKEFHGVPLVAKILILYSILFNFVFMYSIWNIYPS